MRLLKLVIEIALFAVTWVFSLKSSPLSAVAASPVERQAFQESNNCDKPQR
jgi:hypothetical protein